MSEEQQQESGSRRYAEGYYKARGIAGSEQFGYAKEGGEQVSVGLEVKISEKQTVQLSTIMSFSGGAVPYSIERLKALGWTGGDTLEGIDANEVTVQLFYETPPGKSQEQLKVEIKTNGGSRFSFARPMDDQQKRGFMTNLSKLGRENGPGVAKAGASGGGYPASWDESQPPPNQNYKL